MLQKRFFKTKEECEVTFQLEGVEAEEAVVLCEANGWQPLEMSRLKSGDFKVRMRLPLDGRYQFRYLVDGSRWLNDEAADAYVPNEFGSQNSVVVTARNGK